MPSIYRRAAALLRTPRGPALALVNSSRGSGSGQQSVLGVGLRRVLGLALASAALLLSSCQLIVQQILPEFLAIDAKSVFKPLTVNVQPNLHQQREERPRRD